MLSPPIQTNSTTSANTVCARGPLAIFVVINQYNSEHYILDQNQITLRVRLQRDLGRQMNKLFHISLNKAHLFIFYTSILYIVTCQAHPVLVKKGE